MISVLLGVHLTLCVAVFILRKAGVIEARGLMFPAVVCLPVCGVLLLLLEEYRERGKRMGMRRIGLDKLKIEDVKYERIQVDDDGQDGTVPLEDAILVNDAATRRKLMMDILQRNPEEYMDLLQRARLADDTELTHYATTTMMEIQGGYELEIQALENQLQLTEDKKDRIALLRRYRKSLQKYVESGLLTGTILQIYRGKLKSVLLQLRRSNPENRIYFMEFMDNAIELGDSQLPGIVEEGEKRFPNDEKFYRLKLKYYWNTGQGSRIKELLAEIEEKKIYLSHEGKQWFEFWSGRERTE